MSRSSRYRTVPTGTLGTKENSQTMKRRLILLSLMVITALIAGISAAGAQMDAKDEPHHTSNLQRDDKGPASRKCERDRDFTSTGRPAVVSKGCTFIFQFNPLADQDTHRDYQVFWFQSSIQPKNDFCVTNVVSQIEFPEGFRVESKTPKFKRTDNRRKVKSRIRVDGGGGRANDQKISQTYALYPNAMRPKLEGRTLSVEWSGGTRRDLGFAIGVAVSYPQEDLPDGRAHASVDSVLKSDC